ncbi:cysteine desulfurase, mitochondrial [Trichonephila clavipes]|uniref:Cysteine desulfurase, mitochondrial n=1 Tax=Trichonephila clavipes TaxID=2585209 RepID=A0A8X6V4K1_TRICX|nr:cysteine desulfurase, mitochondrial [Trichonephila clavipes]
MSKRLVDRIMAEIPQVIRNGDAEMTYPGCVNLSFAYIEGESLLMALKDVALSSGSACTSASLEPSYVLRAIGSDEDLAHSSIRFGIGRFTTEEELEYTIEKCIHHAKRLREMSPLTYTNIAHKAIYNCEITGGKTIVIVIKKQIRSVKV